MSDAIERMLTERLPFYFDDAESFHPAQTFTEKTAYFGVRLEADVKITRGSDKGATRRQPVLAFVTSDRDVLSASHEALRERGLHYPAATFPEPPEARWRPSAIQDFIEGNLTCRSPSEMYRELRTAFSSRVEFPRPEVADICALYAIGTYLFRLFEAFPYLDFYGSKESGKTKSGNIIKFLAFNAVDATALTGGALYLEVEAHGATLLLDDAEDLGDEEARTIKAMLNVGYKREGRTIRGDWDSKSSRRFSVFSPKVITTIRGVNDTLGSRCIRIRQQPSLDPLIRDRSEEPDSPEWPRLRSHLYVWALSEWSSVRDDYRDISRASAGLEGISGRSWELWRPLVTLATYFERKGVDGLLNDVRGVATDAVREAQAEQADTREGIVLSYLLGKHSDSDVADFTPKQLSEGLQADAGEELSAGSLGWLIKRLGLDGFGTRATKTGGKRYRIPVEKLQQAALRRGVGVPPETSESSDMSETPDGSVAEAGNSDVSEGADGFPPTPTTAHSEDPPPGGGRCDVCAQLAVSLELIDGVGRACPDCADRCRAEEGAEDHSAVVRLFEDKLGAEVVASVSPSPFAELQQDSDSPTTVLSGADSHEDTSRNDSSAAPGANHFGSGR